MQQLLKKSIIFLFVLLLFPVTNSNAYVFELYTGEVKGASRDLTVTKVDDKYFLHKEDLLPGDVIKGKYEITNTSSKSYELTIKSIVNDNSPMSGMKVNGEEEADEWIHNINLKLVLDGKLIYDGSAAGDDNFTGEGISDSSKKFTDGIYIGDITKNSKRILEAEFTIPTELNNEYQEAWARVDWIFSAKWSSGGGGKNPDPKPKPDPKPNPDPKPDPAPVPGTDPAPIPEPAPEEVPLPAPAEIPDEPFEAPKTGDSIANIIIYGVIALGALSGIILIIFSRKKEEK